MPTPKKTVGSVVRPDPKSPAKKIVHPSMMHTPVGSGSSTSRNIWRVTSIPKRKGHRGTRGPEQIRSPRTENVFVPDFGDAVPTLSQGTTRSGDRRHGGTVSSSRQSRVPPDAKRGNRQRQEQGSRSEEGKRRANLPEPGGAVMASQFPATTKNDLGGERSFSRVSAPQKQKLPTRAHVAQKIKPLLPSQINTKSGCALEPF